MSRRDATTGPAPPAPCDRFEREGLGLLEQGLPLDQHFDTCADCAAARAAHERLRAGITEIGRGHPGRADWQARVWAGVARRQARRRRRWPWLAAPAAVALAAALLLVLRPAPGPDRALLAYELHRPGAEPLRGAHARPGDRLAVRARAGGAAHAEVRLYRDGRALVLRCGDQPPCQRRGPEILATVTLEERGRYQLVLLRAAQPLPAPAGDVDRDTAAARAAGAGVDIRDIDVL